MNEMNKDERDKGVALATLLSYYYAQQVTAGANLQVAMLQRQVRRSLEEELHLVPFSLLSLLSFFLSLAHLIDTPISVAPFFWNPARVLHCINTTDTSYLPPLTRHRLACSRFHLPRPA